MELLSQLRALLDARGRYQLVWLFLFMVVGSALDAIGIGVIAPLVDLMRVDGPNDYGQSLRRLWVAVGSPSHAHFLLYVCALLFTVYLLKNLFLAGLYAAKFRFVFGQQAKLSRRLLASYLQRDYAFHLRRNSAELLRNLNEEVIRAFYSVLDPALTVAAEALVGLAIVGLLVAVEPLAAVLVVVLLVGVGGATYLALRRTVASLGEAHQRHAGRMIKAVSEALGAIKEAKVLGRERQFWTTYGESVDSYSYAMRWYRTLSDLPRLVIETLAVGALLALVAVTVVRGREVDSLLSVLALFAVAGIRLMPSANRIVAALTSIRYSQSALRVINEDLGHASVASDWTEPERVPPLELRRHAELRNVTFSYPGSEIEAVSNLSLAIAKGTCVALVGPSGCGKTTVADLLLGLLEPVAGGILVDGTDVRTNLRGWQRQVGYIAQPVYLADDTIRRNIAFGMADETIVESRVWEALRAAQLEDLVQSLPEGLATRVGERGVRLSGGQRQRIGIARALYSDPEVLVMDEATAALDNETEMEIVRAVNRLRGTKTVLIIAHRLSTARNCDVVFFLKAGRLVAQGTFGELLETSADFRAMVAAGESWRDREVAQTAS